MKLAVIVPCYNEEKLIGSLLTSLYHVTDQDFNVFFCDNGSTDDTVSIIVKFIRAHRLKHRWFLVHDDEKGTGSAADTAARRALRHGATHLARTDADCIVPKDWVSVIKSTFERTDTRLIAGIIFPRKDDYPITRTDQVAMFSSMKLATLFGKFRPSNYMNGEKGAYMMLAGCNMAIEGNLYVEAGGFPRQPIDNVHDDHVLMNNVRRITTKYCASNAMIVFCSARRVKNWGLWKTLQWYRNHSHPRGSSIDIR